MGFRMLVGISEAIRLYQQLIILFTFNYLFVLTINSCFCIFISTVKIFILYLEKLTTKLLNYILLFATSSKDKISKLRNRITTKLIKKTISKKKIKLMKTKIIIYLLPILRKKSQKMIKFINDQLELLMVMVVFQSLRSSLEKLHDQMKQFYG